MRKTKRQMKDVIEEESKGEIIGEILKRFTDNTSIHGAKYMLDGSKSRLSRSVWILLGLVAIISLLKVLYNLYHTYTQHPVKTVVKVTPTDHLPFPAVTICNINGMEMSKLKAQDTTTYNVSAAFVNLSLWNSGLRRHLRVGELNTTIPFSINSTLLNATFQDISRQAFADLNTTLIYCSWDGQEENCADLFVSVEMDVGRCFQFNANKPEDAPRRSSHMSGLNTGLEVIVNVRQDEYYFNEFATISAGAQIILHEPGELPDSEKGFMADPGFTHYANTLMEKYRYLPAPFKSFGKDACVDDVDLTAFQNSSLQNNTYTHTLCRRLCVDGLVQKTCGCRMSDLPFTLHPALPLCTVREVFTCYISTYDNLTKWQDDIECPCPRLCHRTGYEVTISSAYFPSVAAQDILHHLNLINKNIVRRNMFALKVYYGELLYYEMAHVPEYTVLSVIGVLGGEMGLLIGASLLSLVELLHLLLTLCHGAARAVCHNSQRHQARAPRKRKT